MRSHIVTPIALSTTILAVALVGPRVAEACGRDIIRSHTVEVRVLSPVPASAGISVAATCGAQVSEGSMSQEGTFLLEGLRGSECIVVATAHECYTTDRVARRRIVLPTDSLLVSIPGR